MSIHKSDRHLWIVVLPILIGATHASLEAQDLGNARINVGKEVHVSTLVDREHDEVFLAVDPTDSKRLAACSIVARKAGGSAFMPFNTHTVLYTSFDGGRSWTRAVEDSAPAARTTKRNASSWDPTCIYGSSGRLYFATGTTVDTTQGGARINVHRSSDGGRTWLQRVSIASGFDDKPWIVADSRASSRYLGRLYLSYVSRQFGGGDESGPPLLSVATSDDFGATFHAPVVAGDSTAPITGPNGGVVLSDGTLIVLEKGRRVILRSTDAGRSFTQIRVSPQTPWRNAASIALDESHGRFRDRIYVAWETIKDGRKQIVVSYSDDHGTSWTEPTFVNDDSTRQRPGSGPDDIMPAIAVNRDGIVGVSWYDRRDIPDNLGYYVRFSASLDGGQSWLPSVRVSTAPNSVSDPLEAPGGFDLQDIGLWKETDTTSTKEIEIISNQWTDGGHYAGLAATTDGSFHPLWVDNRTGVKQIWTATINVERGVQPESVSKGVRDVTKKVLLRIEQLTGRRVGPSTAMIQGNVILINKAAHAICKPVRMEVSEISFSAVSSSATVRLHNSSPTGSTHSIVDLDAGVPLGCLSPGAVSGPVPIRFDLLNLSKKRAGNDEPRSGITPDLQLNVKAHVFANYEH